MGKDKNSPCKPVGDVIGLAGSENATVISESSVHESIDSRVHHDIRGEDESVKFDITDDDIHKFVPQSFVMEASPQKRQVKRTIFSKNSVFTLTFDKILKNVSCVKDIIVMS